MMRITYLLIIALVLSSTFSYSQNRKRYIYTPKGEKSKSLQKSQTSITDIIPTSEKKDIYRIDIILPFQLNLLPQKTQYTKHWPQASVAAMNFYEGVLMAVDSLEKNESMYYDIYVHDISQNKLDSLLNTEALNSTDVIIAGVTSAELKTVSDFSLKNKINTFSVFSPADGDVNNNPFFFLLQPTLSTHLSSAIQYAEKEFSRFPTTILYREHAGDEIAFTQYKTSIRRRYNELKISEDKVDLEILRTKLAKNERNLIYTTFISPESTTHILNQLSEIGQEYELYIIGLPSWKSLPILTNNTLPSNISVIIPYAFQYENDDKIKKHILNEYAKYERGYPSEFTYRGFESLLWIADNLEKNGQYFNLNMSQSDMVSTEFDYQLTYDGQILKYYENKNIYYLKYNDGKLTIIR